MRRLKPCPLDRRTAESTKNNNQHTGLSYLLNRLHLLPRSTESAVLGDGFLHVEGENIQNRRTDQSGHAPLNERGNVRAETLQQLSFGPRFNQLITGVVWPPSLQQLSFGKWFKQPIAEVV